MSTPSKLIDYESRATPSDYFCAHCHATGCKLWRETSFCAPELLCVDCCVKSQKKDFIFDEDGTHDGKYGRSDQIGWYVPCVPHDVIEGYWGYGSVPDEGVRWWTELPLRLRTIA